MGIWGVGLYSNDVGMDVQSAFVEALHEGKEPEEITAQMQVDYAGELEDPWDAPAFWFALADTQWKRGMLLPEVKDKALSLIESGDEVAMWQQEDPALAKKREKVLNTLREKLLSPQPPRKSYRKRNLYQCQWRIGDVYAYQLESEEARERGLFGRYMLVRKVDEDICHPGHTIPIVYVKLTKDDKLPTSLAEYEALEYVQICFTTNDARFYPIDGRRPQEDIAEKSKLKYEVDEYGFLPQFRASLMSTSDRVIPKKLIYVGNFAEATAPRGEFIPHDKINISLIVWKFFEEIMLKKYFDHNKREMECYQRGQEGQGDGSVVP